MQKLRLSLAVGAALLAACDPTGGTEDEQVHVAVTVADATAIPSDGECAAITATRTSDLTVSQYRGPLATASFQAHTGEHLVSAVAYPAPCDTEPSPVPWVSDEQTVSFARGQNTLVLHFRANVQVGVDVNFEDPDASGIPVLPGSLRQTGRNGEDLAAGLYALDGWEVRAVDAAAGTETLLFSARGATGFTITPRGLAVLPDGRFVLQEGFGASPLQVFSGAGSALGAWPVVYPAGITPTPNVDGLEAEDATHFLRTGYLNEPLCDEAGNDCTYGLVERLELRTDGTGGTYLEVVAQYPLPVVPGYFIHEEYPVGVAPLVGGGFAVSTLESTVAINTHLMLLNADGSLRAGPVAVPGSAEGLVDDGTRLISLGYDGALRTFDRVTLAENAADARDLSVGVSYSVPVGLAWRSANGSFLAVNNELRVVTANSSFDAIATVPVDLSSFQQPLALEYKGDSDELVIADRVPPIDPLTSTRRPALSLFNPTTGAATGVIWLQGIDYTGVLRLRTVAYVAPQQRFVVHYRRLTLPNDPVNAQLFFYNLDGSPAGMVDLAPHGFTHVSSVNYLPGGNRLVVVAVATGGGQRLVQLNAAGAPVSSIALDPLRPVAELAPITSGPFVGQLGFIGTQPSEFWRGALP